MYDSVVTSHEILFSCIRTFSLSFVQKFFSEIKLLKTLLRTELNPTNLENRLYISTETPK